MVREGRMLMLCGVVLMLVFSSALFAGEMGIRSEGGIIFIENASARYVVSPDAKSLSFFDKINGREYLDKSRTNNFTTLLRKGTSIPAASVLYERGQLIVRFNPDWTVVKVNVQVWENYFVFEVVEANNPDFDELQFCDLPLTISEIVGTSPTICRNQTFGVSLQALNYFTHCRVAESLPVRLLGSAYPEFNYKGTKLAVLAGPSDKLLTLLGKLELEQGLPHATLGGVWGKISPDAKKSYLFVDYTEANVDKAIEYAHKGGFGYLNMYLDTWATTCGKYKINLENYPRGFESVEATVAKIHAAGLKAGAHTMSGSIYKSDEYVTPIPDPRLAKDGKRILAAHIGTDDTFIPVTESPDGLPLESSYISRGGMDLQIGNELITYSGFSTAKPYGFTGCKRGTHGTYVASHKKDDTVYHMAERYNWYMVDSKSSMADEIAGNIAGAINRCGFDWIYFDGSESLAAQGPYWFYVGKVLAAICERFNREVMVQSSGLITNYNWHHYSRKGTVDWVWLDQKRFVDQYTENDVRIWRNQNLMPIEFGWFGYFLNSDRGESTVPDEVEYVLAKCLGYDASWSFETDMETLAGHGRTDEILEMSKNYETARLRGYFADAVKKQLQKKNSDFKMEREGERGWTISPIQYGPEKYVRRNDGNNNKWNYVNPYSAQPFKVRLKPRPEPAAYDDAGNIVIVSPDDVSRLTPSSANSQLTLHASISREQVKTGDTSIKLSAANTSGQTSAWAAQTLHYDKPINLSTHHPIGFWIYGNATGGALVIQLQNPSSVYSYNHVVDLNFTGWKYVEFLQQTGMDVTNYNIPGHYSIGLRGANYNEIQHVVLCVTNIPPKASATCYISPVKMLKECESAVSNPGFIVNGQKITFPVSLRMNDYLEFWGSGKATVFDPNGHIISEVASAGDVPILGAGSNEIEYLCNTVSGQATGGKKIHSRVTIISKGEPLRE